MLARYLTDINSQTPERIAADDFDMLKRAIDERLQQQDQPIVEPSVSDLSSTPSSRTSVDWPERSGRGLTTPPSVEPVQPPAPDVPAPSAEAHRRYYQDCVTRWSDDRYALDNRFVHLTLLLDQGEHAQGPRWQVSERFQELGDVLARVPNQALVLLGPPGCGKSTLLRHFELENARAVLDGRHGETLVKAPLTFLIPLNDYKARRPDRELPLPGDWLADRWAAAHPELAPLETLLRERRLTLLLDALNEMPHGGREVIRLWKDFLRALDRDCPGNRVVFSCRSLDYSASLSSDELPVPQVRIEPLSDTQVRQFVELCCPEHASALWANLDGSSQLELLRSPYYLKMLVEQTVAGQIPEGRAALFTSFVRSALKREVDRDNPLFSADTLLTEWDITRLTHWSWRAPYELPAHGVLFNKLSTLAFEMQVQRTPSDAAQVRIDYGEALALLGHERAEDILKAGEALGVLEQDLTSEEMLYMHQLLQEYFAARRLAAAPEPRLIQVEWQAERVSPSLLETLSALADADPLPPLPSTGWEESTILAAAMAAQPESFVADLMAVNLALAGRCSAQPDVMVSEALQDRIRRALVQRTQNTNADLRARIAVSLALGELGDPRFERREGPDGAYLLPPLIDIPGGTYSIGSDEGLYEDEAPVHSVELKPFSMGQFPVTNAEWALFMQSGGYEDERWWETEAARAWQRGEGTAEGPKQQWREGHQSVQDFDRFRQLPNVTPVDIEVWEPYRHMSDSDFEAMLDQLFPSGRQTQPASWNDNAFNNPSQPVVGICWHEARAYCAWLSAQTGRHIRLPTEIEWEAAARGKQGRLYAYGNDFSAARCNTFATHIRRTTPIGVFPDGATPEPAELADMTGNVWEWTNSIYAPYPYNNDDSRRNALDDVTPRVMRGGSWRLLPLHVRATYRRGLAPSFRGDGVGFRLACSSSSLSC